MCGIFGISKTNHSEIDHASAVKIFSLLFLLSESRGKEASGYALSDGKAITVFKTPHPASYTVKDPVFQREIQKLFIVNDGYGAAIGHSRLVTDGPEQFNRNNQPVVKNNIAAIHNGIIVNKDDLWRKYADEQRFSDLDSELIPTLIRRSFRDRGNLQSALKYLYSEIRGMTSVALLFADLRNLILATNNGSLYYVMSTDRQAFVFASEWDILHSLIHKRKTGKFFDAGDIRHLEAMQILSLDPASNNAELDDLSGDHGKDDFSNLSVYDRILVMKDISYENPLTGLYVNKSLTHEHVKVPGSFHDHVEGCREKIEKLRRCTRCLLPETFPYIRFDDSGICNYCLTYRKHHVPGGDALKKILEPFRSNDGRPDCVLPFSGGRDSSYTLHWVKKVLGMNPIVFSYDWGMITDLARRNQSRLCGSLGVEHILISADIRAKRENIRRNVLAWLKRPRLGTIPLFMAGDKQYYYHTHRVRKTYGTRYSILGENHLEKTGFKTAFSGAKQTDKGFMAYHISNANKLRMALFYAKEYILNPAYLNRSLLDTSAAFYSIYLLPHDYINLYDYVQWDEQEILRVLKEEYDWETDPETSATWRIGDGTVAFYNYIYYLVAGFTENDTFRSNQVREGMLTREQASDLVNEENKPRFDSIKWYCDTIQIDFETTIKSINRMRKLY